MTNNPPSFHAQKENSYQALLGQRQWQKLHPLVQKRFSVDNKKPVTYEGTMKKVHLSFAGKIFAQICRLIGSPLAEWRCTSLFINWQPLSRLG